MWRTASPEHADFGGLRSSASLVVVRLVVVPLQPLSPRRQWLVVGWADILLDAICGVERALREGCPRTMTGVSQYCKYLFSGHFRQVFSTPMHYPALTLEGRSEHHDRCLSTLVLVYFAHKMGHRLCDCLYPVRGPQIQHKSSSAEAPVCQDREHNLCSLSSYCAAPQSLCSASCDCKCARKWHLHSSSHTCQHTVRQRALTPPHTAPKRSSARTLSSLAPCQTRPRRGRRALAA